jgi:hypothetical protein
MSSPRLDAGLTGAPQSERALSGPSRDALSRRERASAAVDVDAATSGLERLVAPTTTRLTRLHRGQIERDGWPDFEAFDRADYPAALRREAALQWAGRARAEHGSVHQFSALTHALCEARVGHELLGALARLLTDEVRHVDLCARMALACDPEAGAREPALLRFPIPKAPWPHAPRVDRSASGEAARAQQQALLGWCAHAILVACCLGETLSRPMLEAIDVVATEPVARAVARQILRDEHLHAAFGWDALALLWPILDGAQRGALHHGLREAFAGFQQTTACGIPVEALAGSTLEIAPPDASSPPNLGTLDDHQYAMIFYTTIEQEIIPGLEAIGVDAGRAWAERPR